MFMNLLILSIGLLIYTNNGLISLLFLLSAVLLSYGIGRLIPRYKWLLWVSIGIHALVLILFKTQPLTELTLPAVFGLSYFTLKILSYHADIYRGKYAPERSLFRYGLYVTYLPHLYLGPIERFDHFRDHVFANRNTDWNGVSCGAFRILWGLFKKFVIAARVGMIVSALSETATELGGSFALASMVMYYLQLYADFSGGIDIIIGICRMLGFASSENFNAPYMAESVQEFWRRWHMTLGSWLREYVYIPLGGNRKGKFRKAVNLMITFLVSGLWHGVHYIVWGAINGIFVLIGETCKTPSKLLNRIGTFFTISLLWAFFVWTDTALAIRMIVSVFTTCNYAQLAASLPGIALSLADWILLFLSVLAVRFYDLHTKKITDRFHACAPAGRLAVLLAMGLFILVFGMYGIGFEAEAFIYSKF